MTLRTLHSLCTVMTYLVLKESCGYKLANAEGVHLQSEIIFQHLVPLPAGP
jgi:hypothetical protein